MFGGEEMSLLVVICVCVTVVLCVYIISYFVFEASKYTYIGSDDFRKLQARVESLEKK